MYVPDSYWTSVLFATLSTYFSLVSSFCSSDQMFAADFFQIPPRDGHPCLSGYTIPTIRARWGLAPVRHYSCRAYKNSHRQVTVRDNQNLKPVCEPDGIQTHDLQNRNLTLYSAKLRVLNVSGCKSNNFIRKNKIWGGCFSSAPYNL